MSEYDTGYQNGYSNGYQNGIENEKTKIYNLALDDALNEILKISNGFDKSASNELATAYFYLKVAENYVRNLKKD